MKKRLRSYIALGMAMILALTGCGSQMSGEGSQEQADGSLPAVQNVVTDKLYNNEITELPEGVIVRLVRFSGGNIYLGGSSHDQESGLEMFEISVLSLEGELLQSLTLPMEEGLSGSRYCVRDDGSFCISAESVSTNGPGTLQALLFFDSKGELLTKADLTVIPGLRDLQGGPYPVVADDQGRISLLADNAIYLFDEQGNYQDSISFEEGTEGWTITRGGDGSVYTVYASGNRQYLARVDYEDKSMIPVGQGFPDGRNSGMEVYAAGETSFWCSTGTTLWKYDYASGERIQIFDWMNQGIKGDSVKGVTGSEEELKILVRNGGSSQLYTLIPLSDEEMAYLAEHGPTEIVIATAWSHSAFELDDVIIAFNASQRQYKVRLISYHNGDSLSKSDVERLQREMLLDTENIDLINLEYLDAEALIEQGALEDLTPWLENSMAIHREELFEPVLEAFTVDGRLVSIPKHFRMECIYGRAADLGERKGWTLDEFLDFADRYRDKALFIGTIVLPSYVSSSLTFSDMFLEEQNGEMVFNAEQCGRYLEILNAMPRLDTSQEERYAMWQNGEAILSFTTVGSFDTGISRGQDKVFVGLPTADGEKGIHLSGGLMEGLYAMSSQSDCKEGAWAFLEFYLNYEDIAQGGGFPIFKELFEQEADEWMNPEYSRDANGNIVYYEGFPLPKAGARLGDDGVWYPLQGTQEDVDAVLELINRGAYWFSKDKDALDLIISEEAEPYFQGDKDLDTVVDIIGNRWMLYQAEKG